MTKRINSILFATFSVRSNGERTATNGMIEPLTSFFVPKTERFILIEQPHPGSDSLIPFLEIYQHNKLVKRSRNFLTSYLLYPFLKLVKSPNTSAVFKIRDFLSIIEFSVRDNKKHDLFIGLEAINALAGIFLKKLGYLKTVVYYVSDYSTNRYKSKWFNDLYLRLDRFVAMHSDFIWDVSLAMMPARIKVGLDSDRSAPVIHTPNALYPKQIAYLPASKTIPNSLVYVGTLGKINGPDVAIKALKIVLKSMPDAKLHIYGSGEPDMTRLINLTKKLKLRGLKPSDSSSGPRLAGRKSAEADTSLHPRFENLGFREGGLKLTDRVVFKGFISDQVRLSNETKKYAVALAPYLETPGSPRWWADATKIRLYMAAGLPVVTTKVPPLGREIEAAGAGIVTNDTPEDTAKAILNLLKDKKLLAKMKKNAIARAKNNTWENTYSQALKKMKL